MTTSRLSYTTPSRHQLRVTPSIIVSSADLSLDQGITLAQLGILEFYTRRGRGRGQGKTFDILALHVHGGSAFVDSLTLNGHSASASISRHAVISAAEAYVRTTYRYKYQGPGGTAVSVIDVHQGSLVRESERWIGACKR